MENAGLCFIAHWISSDDNTQQIWFSQSQGIYTVNEACLFYTSRYCTVKLCISAIHTLRQISCSFFIKMDCVSCLCSHLLMLQKC